LLDKLPAVDFQLAQLKAQEVKGDGNLDDLGDAIEVAIKAAAESLTGPFRSAALDYLGFSDTGKKPAAKEEREDRAAKHLNRSGRWFRMPCKAHPYSGLTPASWIVAQVAAALTTTEFAPEASIDPQRVQNDDAQLIADSDNWIPQDVHEHYRRTPRSDLQRYGFFERESTTKYIEDIAQLANRNGVPITIYAGISAYTGNEPQRRQFMERLLSQFVQRPDFLKEIGDENDRKEIAERVSGRLADAYPTYLGSIVRELRRRGTNDHPPTEEELRTIEQGLRFEMINLLATGAVPGRFVATAIAACAFAMRRTGAAVSVITSSYNDVLVKEARHIHLPSYLPVKDYKFVTTSMGGGTSEAADDNLGATEVGIAQVNGSLESDTPLILGEGDFFAEYGADLHPTKEHSSWRHDLLTRLLEQTACIFVGSTLTDPDVLEHLARTKHRHRRYALLLQPTFEISSKDTADAETAPVGSLEHYLGRELIAQRYLHLGVVPIIVEHPHQIPQLLREIALKILQGEDYKSYSARTKYWWDYWAKAFGHKPPEGPAGPRSVGLQEHWRAKPLTQALNHIYKVIAEDNRPKLDDEQIIMEVWIRNPYQRDLVLLSRSDSYWLDAATAHRGSLRGNDSEYIAQKAFQQGRSEYGPRPKRQGQWRYAWAIPLVLSREPWCNLPVGVLNIVSNKAEDERDNEGEVTNIAQLLNIANP
jgi:hypothetical protein